MADGVAIPYGIYDLQSNRGTVYVGTSYDTSQFAVECIEKWWRSEGQKRFPGRKHLLVVADTGGRRRNPPCMETRHPAQAVQRARLGRRTLSTGVQVEPNRAPPVHSKNWAGRPLDSYETILNFIRTTKPRLVAQGSSVKKQILRASKSRTLRWRYSTSKNPLPCRSGTTRCVHPRMGNNFCHGPKQQTHRCQEMLLRSAHMAMAYDTPELLLRRDDAESGPSANHGRTLPTLDVSRYSADGSVEILDGVRRGQRFAK